ncbi:guanine nucleotide binding protein, alpha subunit [Cyathus striatus]|nr:guanine nucleotide binding protein, alpha subunit [Cyathus striatus]
MPVPAASKKPTDDPLDEALRPPPDETPEQRDIRLQSEEDARRVSLAIDATIKAERQARRKKRIVRLLLLGQSESGKSTTLRQFQRLYTPTAFREERILWRAVIQLNIVRSIRTILEALSSTSQTSPPTSPYSSPRSRARSISRPPQPSAPVPPLPVSDSYNGNGNGNGNGIDVMGYHNHNHSHNHFGTVNSAASGTDMQFSYGSPPRVGRHPSYAQHQHHIHHQYHDSEDADSDSDAGGIMYRSSPSSTTIASSPIEALKSRLQPLRHVEAMLIAKLVPPNEDEATHLGVLNPPPHHHHVTASTSSAYRNQEIFIRPGPGWRGALSRARVTGPTSYSGSDDSGSSTGHNNSSGRPLSAGNTGLETQDECQEILHQCRRDIMALWGDEGVREILRRKKIRLEEFPGFFLNELERVTSLKYMPNDDDVLKARLKTVGVSEYKFEMEVPAGRDSGTEWRIVDVGGSRSQRPTWAQFFDDVDAIIFLAPISGFDQVLTEDRTVNRLEDSVLLWKAVCSNKLLANVDLVLFLNKCDILDAKLQSGIKLSKYVRSYGDRENDLDSVSKYLRGKFSAIHREYSPNPRKFYAFCTSVTDTATTAGIIASVRDMVIRQHLKQSKLL